MLKEKYNFVDVSVYLRNENGDYVNLTDYTFVGEQDIIELHGIDAEYVLMLCSFMRKNERLIAPVTVSELLTLADIKNQQFVKQIAHGIEDEVAEPMIATMCAAKIKDYAYGRICRDKSKDGINYQFKRLKQVDGKRTYPTLLTKAFKRI